MRIKIVYNGPFLTGRGAIKATKAALEAGFEAHRQRYLPKHFEKVALSRYPLQYRTARQIKRGLSFVTKLGTMTENEKREFFRNRREKQSQSIKDELQQIRANKRPLVKTGLMRGLALHGPVRFVGSGVHRRHMILRSTRYSRYTNPGGVDKVAAVKIVREDEQRRFGSVVEKHLKMAIKGSRRRLTNG